MDYKAIVEQAEKAIEANNKLIEQKKAENARLKKIIKAAQ